MARYNELKAAIEAAIYENEEQEITGDILQNVLKFMVDALGAGYQFIGVAHSDTEPGTPDQRVFYLAAPGTYPGFGFTVPEGSIGVFRYEASWSMETIATGVPAGAVRYDVLQTLSEQAQALARQNISAASEADLEDKQDTIDDLDQIREGASAGATAVQPDDIEDMETQTHASETYATKTELAEKQDIISDLQTIRSNASAGKTASDNLGGHTVGKDVPANAVFTDTLYDDTEVKEDITDIEALIPGQASEDNQLADKAFVNSSVATNTANYISDDGQPFTSADDLPTTGVTNNDYAFVTGTDSEGNVFFDRYKATVSGTSVSWAKEYRLNNSTFTSAQWATIQSGLTSTDKSDLDAALALIDTFGDIVTHNAAEFAAPSDIKAGVLTIKQNGVSKGTFGANESSNKTIELVDTTYESKAAASGGTAVSLVTTGEKYSWNNKYVKPTNGIPKTDLASAVQTSLGKADSAVQPSAISDMETQTHATGTYATKTEVQDVERVAAEALLAQQTQEIATLKATITQMQVQIDVLIANATTPQMVGIGNPIVNQED